MSNASELDQKGFREEAAGLSWPGVFLEFLGIILRRQASENPEMETTVMDSVGGTPPQPFPDRASRFGSAPECGAGGFHARGVCPASCCAQASAGDSDLTEGRK